MRTAQPQHRTKLAKLRSKREALLGYDSYADYGLESQMAEKSSAVYDMFGSMVPQLLQKQGGLKREIGDKYRKEILEVGNSRDLMESYKAFRGQEPGSNALLKRRGLTTVVN